MMMSAYPYEYLDDAMKNLGEAFDYATNVCDIDIDDFMELFISTGLSNSFEKGNPKIVSGLSGTELVMEVYRKAKGINTFPNPQVEYEYSKEYWCGWIIAYYQWVTSRSFKDIFDNILMKEVRELYPTLHEASEEKFIDVLNNIIKNKNNPSNIQRQRKISGYTQKELADLAGVNLRTLQEYESKAKDINKASALTILSLSNVLGCKIEDLLEHNID